MVFRSVVAAGLCAWWIGGSGDTSGAERAFALQHGLAPEARERAATLVQATADALWAGHRDEPPRRRRSRAAGEGMLVFSPEPARPAEVTQPLGAPVELSTQLQAWLILEAAATLTPPERRGDDA